MRKLLYIIIAVGFGCMLSSCKYVPGTFEALLTKIHFLFQRGHSIERDGLEGVDTFALPGDKEQIAASIMANIDTLWVQMRDSLLNRPEVDFGEYFRDEHFLYDPFGFYTLWIYSLNDTAGGPLWKLRHFLSDRPSKFHEAYTDMIVYSKDKLLCWAFIVIKQSREGGRDTEVPSFWQFNVIGRRDSIKDSFKLFVRNRSLYSGEGSEELMENETLYTPGLTYDTKDVFDVNERSLPVLSDPDFFEKHPLFKKFNDSTYNFEWYDRNYKKRHYGGEPDFRHYDYPF
ncbi:MAG: hypothetical protein K2M12_02065 [Muribaculaceae bacterium]|nr:hypothetical protein [Muribaculaceae bacterium]